MSRTIIFTILGLAIVGLALDAAGILPFGILGSTGSDASATDPDLMGTESEDGRAATLRGLGTKGEAKAAEADTATPLVPTVPAEVRGTTKGGAVVRGRVVRKDGRVPMRGVTVTMARYDSLISYLRAEVNGRFDVLEAETGPDGRFAFLDVTPSKGYVVRAEGRSLGLAPTSSEDLDLRGRETKDIGDLELGKGATIKGRVVDHEKRPVAGAQVAASWRVTNALGVVLADPDLAPAIEHETSTNEDGTFVLENLEATPTTVFVNATSGAAEILRSVSLEDGQVKDVGDVTLPEDGYVAGTVHWSDGTPVVGARVFAAGEMQGTVRAVETGADGAFRIEWLPKKVSTSLGVLVQGLPVHMEQGVGVGRDDIKVVFPVPGVLKGVIKQADGGAPVPRFSIQLDAKEPPKDWMQRFVSNQVKRGLGATPFVAEDGAFQFGRVAPGTYTVNVTADGFPTAKMPDVVVTAKDTTTITIELAAGHVARGTVQRANGESVKGARLFVIHGGVEEGREGIKLTGYINDREPDAVAGGAGRFELPPQSPGRYDVIASYPNALPAVVRGVDLRTGDAEGIEFRLPPSGTVKGRLLDENARPAKGETIYILYRDGTLRTERVDDEGRFEVGGLPVGRCLARWLSMLDAGAYGRFLRNSSTADEKEKAYDELRQRGEEHGVTDGGVVTITLRIPQRTQVSGRVLVEGEPPGPDQRSFWISGRNGSHWQNVEIAEDGRYEARLLPGTYSVYLPEGKNSYAIVEVAVPNAATATIDLGK